MPAAEVDIDVALVRELLRAQHPELAELELERVAEGWDNVVFRLGDASSVRMPRRESAAELIRAEQRWLPEFAQSLPFAVPAPTHVGVPSQAYRWHWSVVPWFEGRTFAPNPPSDIARFARQLGRFAGALQRPVDGLPINPFRGRPLSDLDANVQDRFERLARDHDIDPVRTAWATALAAPDWPGAPMLLHGDLHPLNVVVDDDGLIAVIDFGDLTGGDPATDYLAAWLFFDQSDRAVFRSALDDAGAVTDDDTWERGRGAAISWCTAVAANSSDHPVLHRIALDGLDRIVGRR